MKKQLIETSLSKEEIAKLQEIANEICTQNNRATSNVLFMVQTDAKRYVSCDWDWEYMERREDYDRIDLCDTCKKLYDENEELPEECNDCNTNCFVYYNIEQKLSDKAGIFLTSKACDEHIKLNHYHYWNPISYGISAWRNPEMQLVRKFFKSLIK